MPAPAFGDQALVDTHAHTGTHGAFSYCSLEAVQVDRYYDNSDGDASDDSPFYRDGICVDAGMQAA